MVKREKWWNLLQQKDNLGDEKNKTVVEESVGSQNIFVVPPHTELGDDVLKYCILHCLQKSIGDVNAWVKSINGNDEYALHVYVIQWIHRRMKSLSHDL